MSHSHCHKLFTELLRTLSQDENLVELRRQDLSMHYDFEPSKAFGLIDVDNDGSINAEEVVTFLHKHNIVVDLKEVKDVIYDYDSNNDGDLGLAEFCQLTLPSTNPILRSVAEQRRFACTYKANSSVPADCVNLLVRLFEKELTLQRNRNSARNQLTSCPDYQKVRLFDALTHGRREASVPDLIYFLERNGFYPRREDVEAILRRIDHSGDQSIGYDEFCDLVQIQDKSTSVASPDRKEETKFNSPLKTTKSTTSKPASESKGSAQRAVFADEERIKERESDSKKAHEERDRIRYEIENERRRQEEERELKIQEAKDAKARREAEYQAESARREADRKAEQERRETDRKEAEEKRAAERREADRKYQEMQKIREEEAKARQVENFMFLRFIRQVVSSERHLEALQEILFSHHTFSVAEAFKLLDTDGDGQLSSVEFHELFADFGIDEHCAIEIIDALDRDGDGQISIVELTKALTPKHAQHINRCQHLSFDQTFLFRQSWMRALADLLRATASAHIQLANLREELQLNGDHLFDGMDDLKQGHISVNIFGRWIKSNCGFEIQEHDLMLLQKKFDYDGNFRLERDEVIAFVNPIALIGNESEGK